MQAKNSASEVRHCDNYNLKAHKYVCITTNQPNTKSNPNPNPNPTYTARNSDHSTKYSHPSYVSR